MSSGGTYSEGKIKHGASEGMQGFSRPVRVSSARELSVWAEMSVNSECAICNREEHPWQFMGREKENSAWDRHAVATRPVWLEWRKLGSHRRWGQSWVRIPVLWVSWKDFAFYLPRGRKSVEGWWLSNFCLNPWLRSWQTKEGQRTNKPASKPLQNTVKRH